MSLTLFGDVTSHYDRDAFNAVRSSWAVAGLTFRSLGQMERAAEEVEPWTLSASLLSIIEDWGLDLLDARECEFPEPESRRIERERLERASLRESADAARAMRNAQAARRSAEANYRKTERATGRCARCVNGYIPNVRQDGAICYRCGGTGRPR